MDYFLFNVPGNSSSQGKLRDDTIVTVGQTTGNIFYGDVRTTWRRWLPYRPGSWQHASGIAGRWQARSRGRWRNVKE